MKKQKISILLYIQSFIFSLCTSYLICRLYNLNINGIICIVLSNILATEFLTHLANKYLKFDEIKKEIKSNKKIIIILLATAVSIVILVLNFKLFTYKYDKTNIIIHSKNLNSNNVIKSIYVNNVFYNVENKELIDSSKNNIYGTSIGVQINELDEHTIKIEIPKSINIKLIINKQDEYITILDGQLTSTFKLESDEIEYTVKSNSYIDNLFFLRIIISLIVLLYFNGLIIIALLYLDSDKRCELITTIIVAVGAWIHFRLYTTAAIYNDSMGYIWDNYLEIFQGKLKGRTPFYPLIIKICQIIFPNNYLRFVCIIQYIIWFIAIIYLYKLLKLLIKNRKIIMFATIIYALSPAIIDWNNCILTESIALSGTIILVYFMIKYLKNPKILTGVTAIIIAFVLTFHRPISIIYVVILELFWIMRFILDRKYIKKDFLCFLVSTFTIILIVIYAIVFQKTFKIYSISDVVPKQQLYVCMHEGFYKNSGNEQFIKEIEQALSNKENSEWLQMKEVLNKHQLDEVKEFTNSCIKNSIPQYIRYFIKLSINNLNTRFSYYSLKIVNPKFSWLTGIVVNLLMLVTFTHSYIAIFMELALVIYLWIENKKIPWIHFGLFAFPLIIIVSSFLGTCAEYMRTAICVAPFTYISLTMFLDKLFSYREEK